MNIFQSYQEKPKPNNLAFEYIIQNMTNNRRKLWFLPKSPRKTKNGQNKEPWKCCHGHCRHSRDKNAQRRSTTGYTKTKMRKTNLRCSLYSLTLEDKLGVAEEREHSPFGCSLGATAGFSSWSSVISPAIIAASFHFPVLATAKKPSKSISISPEFCVFPQN